MGRNTQVLVWFRVVEQLGQEQVKLLPKLQQERGRNKIEVERQG